MLTTEDLRAAQQLGWEAGREDARDAIIELLEEMADSECLITLDEVIDRIRELEVSKC